MEITNYREEERSFFFYIKYRDLNENEFSSLDNIRINKNKVSYITDEMSNKEILFSYAEKLLEVRKQIIEYFKNNPEILIDIAFNKVSTKILANDLKFLRDPEVDAVAFNRQVCSVITMFKQIFSKIEYYYRKKKHRDSEENINMRKFLVKLWKFTKEEMINELRKIQTSIKSESRKKLYERYIFLLQRDRTIFEKIHNFEDTLFASLVKKLDLDKEQQEILKDEMPKIIEKVKSNSKVKLAISNAKTVSVNEEMLLDESVADKVSDSIINAIASVAAVIYMILLGLKFTIKKSALFILVGLSFIVSLVALIGSFTYGFLYGLLDRILD